MFCTNFFFCLCLHFQNKNSTYNHLSLSHNNSLTQYIIQQFDRYFAANASSNKGGSFYLQSKIYRANELLQEFQTEKYKDDIAGKKAGSNGDKG